MNSCVFLLERNHPHANTELLFKPALDWMKDTFYSLSTKPNFLELDEAVSKEDFFSSLKEFEDSEIFICPQMVPLLQKEDLERSYHKHIKAESPITSLIANEKPFAYWVNGEFLSSVFEEWKDLNLKDVLKFVFDSISSGEISEETYRVLSAETAMALDCPVSFSLLHEAARKRINESWQQRGVYILDPSQVWIGPDAEIGKGSVILPGTIIKGRSKIGSSCTIGPQSLVSDSVIGDRTILNATQIYESKVDEDVKIGPFCHIRPNSTIRHHVKIGDFVEVKNSEVGAGTAISHLTYIGDSDVGQNVNFGCGVVTVNYDGVHKNRCKIGDGAFIGCNTNLVAPVSVGKDGYTGAGSTITKDVPDYALGIERAEQVIRPDFSKEKLKGRKKKV